MEWIWEELGEGVEGQYDQNTLTEILRNQQNTILKKETKNRIL